MTTATKPTIEKLREYGVVGAGGAGFPAYAKFSTDSPVDTFVINAAECEPLLHKDKEILRCFADEVLLGMRYSMELSGASTACIGIKEKYEDVIRVLEPLLRSNEHVHALRDFYPAGDEFCLVYMVTGRVIPPGGLPLHVGTIVSNVETLLNIARPQPVTTKYITVAGNVVDPVTLHVPVGISFGELVEAAGGAIGPSSALIGGAMMGRLLEDFDKPVTRVDGGLIVLPEDHLLLQKYRRNDTERNRIGKSACDQCVMCTELCPRYLLGHPIEPHKAMRTLLFDMSGEPLSGSLYCCECNLCSLIACPEDLAPKDACVQHKRVLQQAGVGEHAPGVGPHFAIEDRRPPLSRLIRKLGLSSFINRGPLKQELLPTSRVRLPLRQHVGVPAEPIVDRGQRVEVGEIIARPPDDKLGVPIHASIAGRVTDIGQEIVIEA